MLKDEPGTGETQSAASSPWDAWCREYEAQFSAWVESRVAGRPDRVSLADMICKVIKPSGEPSSAAVERLHAASQSDVKWLVGALCDERRKWFVADLARRAQFLPDDICEPLLRASVEELSPEFNRRFVEPCKRVFGARRVNEYLLAVLESGDDFHKAGAVCALYWAGVSVSYRFPLTWPLRREDANQEELAAYEALMDLWERKQKLFLETFVWNPNLTVRRCLLGRLDLDESAYPDSHKPLVARAIQIARDHPDDYIRQQLQLHLGETSMIPALPAREPNPRATS